MRKNVGYIDVPQIKLILPVYVVDKQNWGDLEWRRKVVIDMLYLSNLKPYFTCVEYVVDGGELPKKHDALVLLKTTKSQANIWFI